MSEQSLTNDLFFEFDDSTFYKGEVITLEELLQRWPGCSEERLIMHIVQNELTAYNLDGEVFFHYEDPEYDEAGHILEAGYSARKLSKSGTKLLSKPPRYNSTVFIPEDAEDIEEKNPTYCIDSKAYKQSMEYETTIYTPPAPEVVAVWEKAANLQKDSTAKKRLLVTLLCSQGVSNKEILKKLPGRNVPRDCKDGIELGKSLDLPPLPMPPARTGAK